MPRNISEEIFTIYVISEVLLQIELHPRSINQEDFGKEMAFRN